MKCGLALAVIASALLAPLSVLGQATSGINSGQIKDGAVQRHNINTTKSGQAVITKVVAGPGISLSSTGADSGTGDVTVSVSGATGVSSVNGRTGSVTLLGSDVPLFGASGSGHAPGGVPDPGAAADSTHFLREDGTWAVPPGSGGATGTSDHNLSLNSADDAAGNAGFLDAKLGVSGILTIGDVSGVRVIGLGPAGAGVSGYLLGTDWNAFSAKEPSLGNPGVSGYVLSSTATGIRSWIAPQSGPAGATGATGAQGPAGPNYPLKNGTTTLTSAPTSLSFGAGLTATASGNDVTVTATGGGSASYTLPPATATTLGGVIVGSGLSVSGSGVLTANANLAVSPVSGYQSLLQVAPGFQVAPVSAGFAAAPLLTDRASGDSVTGYKGVTIAAAKPSSPTFQSSNSIANGIIAAWPLSENTGTTVHDISGNALNLTFTGSPTWATGPNGTVLSCTSSDGLTIADSTLLDPAAGFTISGYVNAGTTQSFSRLFRKQSSAGAYYSITNASSQATTGTAYTFGSVGNAYESAYHLFTYTINTTSNTGTLYVDGTAIQTVSGSGSLNWDTAAQFIMGGTNNDGVNGKIDVCYEWSRSLSGGEVASLAANPYQLIGTTTGGSAITAVLSPGSLGYLPIGTIKFTRTWSQQLSEVLEYSMNGTTWTAIPTGYTPASNGGTAASLQTTVTLSTPIAPLYLRYSGKDTGNNAQIVLTDFSVS